jgi:hypothetical protein
MDKEKVKEIFGEYWDGIKDKSLWNLSNKEFENIAYKQVAEELKQGDYKPHIQLKAVEKAKGNKEVIESLYIQFRVSELTDELKAIASDYEARVNAERRELEVELKAKRKAENKAKKEAEIKRQKENYLEHKSEYDRQLKIVFQTVVYGSIILFVLFLIFISL